MAKVAAKKKLMHGGRQKRKRSADRTDRMLLESDTKARRLRVSATRFEAVMKAAERSGLLKEKSSRIGGRVSPALLEQAKRQTGIETDTDLIEFALASVALEDKFAEAFKESRGRVDADLKLGF